MKRLLFIFLLFSGVASAQTVGQFRYDTTKFLKVGGFNEVKIQNKTMDSLGIFTNVGGGWGQWIRPKAVAGGIKIGNDTVLVSGGGGTPIDTTNKWVQNVGLSALGDSQIVVKNGVRTASKIKGGITSIVPGTNISVDNTDPANPIVSSTGGYNSLDTLPNGIIFIRDNGTRDTAIFNISSVTYYGLNGTSDSTILSLSNGTRYAVKLPTGGGGGGGDAYLANTQTFTGVNTFNADINAKANINVKAASGTNRDFRFYNASPTDNLPLLNAYPTSGTNVGMGMAVIPKGTGFSSGIKSQISIFNTDLVADATNYEALVTRAAGSKFLISSFKNGTGTLRPISISSGEAGGGSPNTDQLLLNIDGTISTSGKFNSIKLSAGTATAGTAPLKLTSGLLLSTPEPGSIEYDGIQFTVSPSSGRYTIVMMTSGSGAPAFTPITRGTMYIDTTNKKIYVATASLSSADWTILN